eukprot:gene4610-6487_t
MSEEAKFAKALVHPDGAKRAATLKTLKRTVQLNVSMNELEMLKLWKALYYCVWLADKVDVQQELSIALCDLVDSFSSFDLVQLYFRVFFKTILREWSFLDQYRVEKFYLLVRYMTNKLFTISFKQKWTNVNDILSILTDEILHKTPNGIRFHITDIYLEELHKVTDGNISSINFIQLIQPFINCLLGNDDQIFKERISSMIVLEYFNKYYKFKTENENDDQDSIVQFTQVDGKILQKKLFDLASDERTSEKARKILYNLHKEASQITNIPFVKEEDIIADILNTSKKNKKAKPSKIHDNSNDSKQAEETNEKKEVKNKKSKQNKIENNNDPIIATSKIIVQAIENDVTLELKINDDNNKVKSQVTSQIVPKESSKLVSTKQKQDSKGINTKLSSNNPTITPSIDKNDNNNNNNNISENQEEASPSFIAAKKFSGRKLGYIFTKGKEGLGYYLDKREQNKAKKSTKRLSSEVIPQDGPVVQGKKKNRNGK